MKDDFGTIFSVVCLQFVFYCPSPTNSLSILLYFTTRNRPKEISGNAGSRCNNCPSRGCKTCPMFGVGKNPEYERKERERKARIERNRLKRQREEESKSVDL